MKEALKLALEALKYHTEQTRPIGNTNEVMAVIKEFLNYSECNCNQGQSCHVCDPIHPALAQPEQEPVAWITPDGEGFRIRFSPPVNDVPLGWDALYTTPPQRKPLTKAQVLELWEQTYVQRGSTGIDFARAIEAAHGIKE